MTPYLLRSGAVHAALFGAFLAFSSLPAAPRKTYYTIDFLNGGPSSVIGAPGPELPAKAPTAAEKDQPLPSLKRWLPKARAATLHNSEMAVKGGKDAPEAVPEAPVMSASRKDSELRSALKPGGRGGAQVSADLADFPYPWYLARLRSALWSQWSERMPRGGATCTISFIIARGGSVSEIGVSERSGDSDFDYAAMAAVQAAAPFPPLPDDFSDPTLKVHVRFQSLL